MTYSMTSLGPAGQSAVRRYMRFTSRRHPAYAVTNRAAIAIRSLAEKHLRGRLLDLGCGTKTKMTLLNDLVDEYIGLDHEGSPHGLSAADLVGTAYEIPAEDGSFDSILSTAVLEHLEEPRQALGEVFRVLKPGGFCLFTAPLHWHVHEAPRDYYRYTRYGLTHLFESSGFRIVCINALSGFWLTCMSQAAYFVHSKRRGPRRHLVDMALVGLNGLAPRIDQSSSQDERFTWMYVVVAQRPERSDG